MKLKYIIDDIASLLTEYYIQLNIFGSEQLRNRAIQKKAILQLHIKQAIQDTYSYMYEDLDEVWMIDIWDGLNLHTYELNHDVDYDATQMHYIIHDMHERLNDIAKSGMMFSDNSDLICLRCVPFDGFSITTHDIVSLLDVDVI